MLRLTNFHEESFESYGNWRWMQTNTTKLFSASVFLVWYLLLGDIEIEHLFGRHYTRLRSRDFLEVAKIETSLVWKSFTKMFDITWSLALFSSWQFLLINCIFNGLSVNCVHILLINDIHNMNLFLLAVISLFWSISSIWDQCLPETRNGHLVIWKRYLPKNIKWKFRIFVSLKLWNFESLKLWNE